jgi:hypothetical protein
MQKLEMIDKLYEWYLQEECQKPDPEEVKESIEEYEKTAKRIVSGEAEIKLWDSVCSYGQSREHKGFCDGFRLAFQILQEVRV